MPGQLRTLFLLLALQLLLTGGLRAQERFKLYGAVRDTSGQPVAGVVVELHELKRGAITDSSGRFEISQVRRGRYHVHLHRIGFHHQTFFVRVQGPLEVHAEMVPSALETDEIVVEANQKNAPGGQTQSLRFINRRQLLRNTAAGLAEKLAAQPGLSFINFGMGISKPVVRGMSGARVSVLEQGVRQEGQQWATDHGLEIDPLGVEEVTIVKGPNALLYGSDAIAGVILIDPAPPPPAGAAKADAYLGYRSVNRNWMGSAAVEGNRKGNYFRVRLSGQHYADYQVPADTFHYNRYVLPLPSHGLNNTAGRIGSAQILGGLQRDWGFTQLLLSHYQQEAGLFAGAVGIPRAYQLQEASNLRNLQLPRMVIRHTKALWRTNLMLGQHWLEVDAGLQQNDRREYSSPHAHGDQNVANTNLAHGLLLRTATLNARLHLHQNEGWNAIAGLNSELQQNQLQGYEFIIPAFRRQQLGLFYHQEWQPLNALRLVGGLRLDYGHQNLEGFTDPSLPPSHEQAQRAEPLRREFLLPSFAFGLSWTPGYRWQAKLHMANSFRYPQAAELSANGVHHGTFRHEQGAANLQAERAWHLEPIFRYRTTGFELEFSPFYTWFPSMIYLSPAARFSPLPEGGQLYQYRQARAELLGGEVFADYHPIEGLHLSAGLEYLRATNLETELPIPLQPPPSARLELAYAFAPFAEPSTSLNTRMVGQAFAAQHRVARNEPTTPAYQLIHLHQNLTFPWGKQQLELGWQLRNLLNTAYLRHLSRYRMLNIPEPGRNLTLYLRLQF